MSKKSTPIDKIARPFQKFLHTESSGGIILLAATVVALIWANSPWSSLYNDLWHSHFKIGFDNFNLDYSLHHWINDGLMVIFFFVVGLEIKRELLVGELSSVRQAALPIAAALGGMIVPAAIYFAFNSTGNETAGWGIPMATDIAFVVGLFALLGKNVPVSLKIFITALAIVDDIGAVLVIAVFYSSEISLIALGIAAGLILLLILLNKLGVRSILIYSVVGFILWLAFLKSGIHATIAGVLLAFTIPAYSRLNTKEFLDKGNYLLKEFDYAGEEGANILTNEPRQSIVQELKSGVAKMMTPLQIFEHGLHPWVSFFIMPVFALANAGVGFSSDFFDHLVSPVSVGIIAGLFAGKQLGIFSFSWLAVKLGIAAKPNGVTWKLIYGAAVMAGIGFTMSLFISNLAFADELLVKISKVGILTASFLSGVIGFIILKTSINKTSINENR
ncbi:MAG: Na+/H+ antiporter NhaA [Ignavibacteriaceae bacterium]|nr:Na+/H+ antiporter NhaA [Ignavibacteriaceae bacterium]